MPSNITLGNDPRMLAKRHKFSLSWCGPKDLEFDEQCDPKNPKVISFKQVVKAFQVIKHNILKTPLIPSKRQPQFYANVFYKLELFNRTHSFKDRCALHALLELTPLQKSKGVVTTSLGNWAVALALYGKKLNISVVIVMPIGTDQMYVDKCKSYEAKVVLSGHDFIEAKSKAFAIANKQNRTYICGYDNPSVIAAAGSIGVEILKDLPSVDAILVPVGGGGLLAGITIAVKRLKPECLIYGIEPAKCCNFYKAMQNEYPYRTVPSKENRLTDPLAIPIAGYNAYATCSSLIDKLALVHEDNIAQAITCLVEHESFIPEGAGALGLAALIAKPDIMPELRDKNVVCVVTGGNIDVKILPWIFQRTYAIEGRWLKFTATVQQTNFEEQKKMLQLIAKEQFVVVSRDIQTDPTSFNKILINFICEGRNLSQACKLRNELEKAFPGVCQFVTEPFSPLPKCICYPKLFNI